MMLGIGLIIFGLILLPFGITALKEGFEKHKDLPLIRRISVSLLEIIDIFTTPVLSTWLLGLSFILIVGGVFILLK